MGFPFLAGFYSKDLILEFAYSRYVFDAYFIYSLGVLAAICTAIYSIRLIFLVFSDKKLPNNSRAFYYYFQLDEGEGPLKMFFPLFFLAIASIFVGYLFSDLMVGNGNIF